MSILFASGHAPLVGGPSKFTWKVDAAGAGRRSIQSGGDLVGLKISKPFPMSDGVEIYFEGEVAEHVGPSTGLAPWSRWHVEYEDGDTEDLPFQEIKEYVKGEQARVELERWEAAAESAPMSRAESIASGEVSATGGPDDGARPAGYDTVRDSFLVEAIRDTAPGTQLTDACMNLYAALLRLHAPPGVTVLTPDVLAMCTRPERCRSELSASDTVLALAHLDNEREDGNHWCMVLVNNKSKRVTLLDSALASDFASREALTKTVRSAVGDGYAFSTYDRMPQQDNSVDCGVFVLEAARRALRKEPQNFGASDIRSIRRRIAFELFADQLLEWPVDEEQVQGRRAKVSEDKKRKRGAPPP